MSKRSQYTYTNRGKRYSLSQIPSRQLGKTSKNNFKENIFKSPNNNDKIPPRTKTTPFFVLDTNVLITCVDILRDLDDKNWHPPLDFQPDINQAHLIIPLTVIHELNCLKTERSFRGMRARTALSRLDKLLKSANCSMIDVLCLKAPIELDRQKLSILPLPKHFLSNLPWAIDSEDNDTKIALTALYANVVKNTTFEELPTILPALGERRPMPDDSVLITNDTELRAISAIYGVRTVNFTFKPTSNYTGIRKLTVPTKLFKQFYYDEKLSEEDFKKILPDEPSLIDNEFIVMKPQDDIYPRSYFAGDQYANIARYHKENHTFYPLRYLKRSGVIAPNSGIASYLDALHDNKIKVVIATGSAGTGKSYQAINYAIHAIKKGEYRRAVLVTTASAKNPLGALPGGTEDKMEPMVAFAKECIEAFLTNTPEFKEKRRELRRFGDQDFPSASIEDYRNSQQDNPFSSNKSHSKSRSKKKRTKNVDLFNMVDEYSDFIANDFEEPKSNKTKTFYPSKSEKQSSNPRVRYEAMLTSQVDYIYNNYFISVPYEQVQGRSFEDSIVILDEFQRVKIDDADTLITRPAKNSKLIICGDVDQIHDSTPEKCFSNGLTYAQLLFFDWQGCANIHLTDNLRSDIAGISTANRNEARRRLGLL